MGKLGLGSILLLFLVCSCNSAMESGIDSLIGTWEVKEIYQYNPSTGNFAADKAAEGIFRFTKTNCGYDYTFNSINKTDSFEYKFQISKVNSGFTKVRQFTILGNDSYNVRFGDQTSDAHINATEIALEKTIINDSLSYELLIQLAKL